MSFTQPHNALQWGESRTVCLPTRRLTLKTPWNTAFSDLLFDSFSDIFRRLTLTVSDARSWCYLACIRMVSLSTWVSTAFIIAGIVSQRRYVVNITLIHGVELLKGMDSRHWLELHMDEAYASRYRVEAWTRRSIYVFPLCLPYSYTIHSRSTTSLYFYPALAFY